MYNKLPFSVVAVDLESARGQDTNLLDLLFAILAIGFDDLFEEA